MLASARDGVLFFADRKAFRGTLLIRPPHIRNAPKQLHALHGPDLSSRIYRSSPETGNRMTMTNIDLTPLPHAAGLAQRQEKRHA
jgi:hypothetical protein